MKQLKNMKWLIAALVLTLSICFALTGCGSGDSSENGASVTTKYGTYVGVDNDNGVKSFKGIPYARQPVGDLRWKEAQPLEESSETIDCSEYGNTPIQVKDEFEGASLTPQGEDCLTVNEKIQKQRNRLWSGFTVAAIPTAEQQIQCMTV